MFVKKLTSFAFFCLLGSNSFAQNQVIYTAFLSELPSHKGFAVAALPQVMPPKIFPSGGEHLKLYGKSGEMMLYRNKDQLTMALTLPNNEKTCEADLTPQALAIMTPIGKPAGVPRFYSKLQNCDVFIDLLPDAARLIGGTCVVNTSCTVELSGLWGASENELPLDKSFEKQWSRAEKRMNSARKSMTKKLGSTQQMRDFLSDHLDFTANRLRTCQDYGTGMSWCSLKLTELRTLELETRLK